jgi:hypothetical protein
MSINKKKLNLNDKIRIITQTLNPAAAEGLDNIVREFKISKKDVLYLLLYSLNKKDIENIIINNINYNEMKGLQRAKRNFYGTTAQQQFIISNKLKREIEALSNNLSLTRNLFLNFLLEYFKNKENLDLLNK